MNKIFIIIISLLLSFMFFTYAFSNENFFGDAVKKYQSEKYDEARFLFERNIVFNPKDAKSYLYLAKIFKLEEIVNQHNFQNVLLKIRLQLFQHLLA